MGYMYVTTLCNAYLNALTADTAFRYISLDVGCNLDDFWHCRSIHGLNYQPLL